MAKLYFRYGTVASGKSLSLVSIAKSYQIQGKRCLVVKPAFDTRFGLQQVKSRSGLETTADVLLEDDDALSVELAAQCDCVLVDEANFLTPKSIDSLRAFATRCDKPIICFGLRSDFKTQLFPGSRRLFELADSIEEIKTVCFWCNRKATFNVKFVDGKATTTGPAVELGADETYLPACHAHYIEVTEQALPHPNSAAKPPYSMPKETQPVSQHSQNPH